MEFFGDELIFKVILDIFELKIHSGCFEDFPKLTERVYVLNRVLLA